MLWSSYSRPGRLTSVGISCPFMGLLTTFSPLFTVSWYHVSPAQGTEDAPESPSGLGRDLKGLQKATGIVKMLGSMDTTSSFPSLMVFNRVCGKNGLFHTPCSMVCFPYWLTQLSGTEAFSWCWCIHFHKTSQRERLQRFYRWGMEILRSHDI